MSLGTSSPNWIVSFEWQPGRNRRPEEPVLLLAMLGIAELDIFIVIGQYLPQGEAKGSHVWQIGIPAATKNPLSAGNERGLYDPAGKVWEFCRDRYHPNTVPAPVDPSGPQKPAAGAKRVAKGGCFENSPHLLDTGRP